LDDQGFDLGGRGSMIFEALLSIVVLGAGVGIVACWIIGVNNLFRPVVNRQEDIPLFSRIFESPIDILFRPSKLTEGGLIARRRCIYAFIGFLLCCLALFAAEFVRERFL
jgi:hypothetical protein